QPGLPQPPPKPGPPKPKPGPPKPGPPEPGPPKPGPPNPPKNPPPNIVVSFLKPSTSLIPPAAAMSMKLMVARREIAGRAPGGCYRRLFMPEMDRRRMMMVTGFGALAALIPTPKAGASPLRPPPTAPVAATGAYLFHDEFDGPAGSVPDPSKWVVANHRTPINNPAGFDRPEFFGQYRNSRQNAFLDGKSNLVLRATKDGNGYFGGLVSG